MPKPINAKRKQEIFANEVAKGANYTEAFKTTFPHVKKWTKDSIINKASAYARQPEVKALIQTITAKISEQDLDDAICSAKECREILSGIIRDERAKADERVRAIKQLSDMSGYNAPTVTETRIRIRAETISDDELRRIAYGTD